MKIAQCLCLLCICTASYGQAKLDSLKKLLQDTRAQHYPVGEAYQLFQIGYYFYKIDEFDSSIRYYNEGLRANPTGPDSASLLNGIGAVYSTMGSPNRSVVFYEQAISLWNRLRDTTNAVIGGNNLAIIYKDLGLYDEALETAFDNLPKLEKQPPSRTLGSSYNTIGSVYTRIQDYDKAYLYYRKALTTRLAIAYDQGVGQSYNNIGELFIEMGQYDSALDNLYRATSIREKIQDSRGLGRTLTHVGNTLLQLHKPADAQKALSDALSMNRSAVDHIGEVASLNGLASVFIAKKEFASAESYLDQALRLIYNSNIKEHLKKNLELHAEVYRSTDDKRALIATLEKIMAVEDSLLSDEKVESLVALEVRYETGKKEQEIISLQQQRRLDKIELETRQTQIYSLLIGLVLLAVIALLAYRIYKQTQRAKLSAELHTKEVQHRMKNHLQILSSIFTIQASLLTDKQAQELVKSTEGRVTAMALLHRKLYERDGASELSLRDYVNDLLNSILFAYGFDENKLKTTVDVVEINLPVDKIIRIGLILNELITNALKYAYSAKQELSLIIRIWLDNGALCFEIADNGERQSFEPVGKSSFGLKMVHSIVKELKGNISSSIDNGTKYLIVIPENEKN